MKKLFQTLAVAAVACLGFASCNDEFDTTDHATYPAEAPGLGVWVADQTATEGDFVKDYFHELNITLSAAGDTVWNVTSVATDVNTLGLPANYPVCTPAGKLQSYDATAGVAYLEFPQTEVAYLVGLQSMVPARGYVTYNRTADQLSVDMDFLYNNSWRSFQDYALCGTFTLTRAKYPSLLAGYWYGQDSTGTPYIFYLIYDQEKLVGYDQQGQPVTTTLSGQFVVGNAQDYCLWSYDKTIGTGTVTSKGLVSVPEGTTYTLQYNEIGQLTYNTGTETVVLDRVAY